MKNTAIFSSELICFILVFLGKPQQSIFSYICLALTIINAKIVVKELLGLANLSEAQTLCIYRITEVIVVRKDKNLLFATFQIVTLRFKGLDNSQKLAIVSLIPSFYRNHFSWKDRYQVPLAQINLSDYSI